MRLASQELLRRYVFFVLPVLNPDGCSDSDIDISRHQGVAAGHHRLDLRGENLNRVYGKA